MMASTLNLAFEHHQAGRLDQAAALYREVLAAEPDNPDAFHLLGMVLHQQGRHEEAIGHLERAIALSPGCADYHNNLATIRLGLGDFAAAANGCREAIRLDPRQAQAHNNLGNALQALGELDPAVDCYRRALSINPQYLQAHANLGGVLQRLGQLDEAMTSCRRALDLRADFPEALNNLGEIYRSLGRPEEAIPWFQWALFSQPRSAEIHNNLGNAFKDAGRLEDAVVCYRQALEIRPKFARALNNLGVALRELGQLAQAAEQLEQAIQADRNYAPAHSNLANVLRLQTRLDEAEDSYHRALELDPNNAEVQNNLGELRWLRRETTEAVALFQQAIAAAPNLPTAHFNLGNVLREQGKLEEAANSYRRALDLEPQFVGSSNNLALTLSEQGKTEEAYSYFQQALALNPLDTHVHSHVLVCQQYRWGVSLAELARSHAGWNERHAVPLQVEWQPNRNDRNPDRRLKVGFVSRDLRRHPVGYFLAPVLESLDRGQFESICYYDQVLHDDVTNRIQAASGTWHVVKDLSDDELAARVRAEEVDILVDLAGHTASNRLLTFARRPAPVQATWMGYVGTTGLEAIDFLIADRFHTPEDAQPYYQENIVRLPHGYVCYQAPAYSPKVEPLPALSAGAVTFGSFNNPAKISPRTAQLWCAILKRLPASRLILKYPGLDDPGAQAYFAKLFATDGIDAKRIEFLGASPHEELLRCYGRIDIALDPLPYSGGLTTCEALWMGVPVVTCPGETFAGRHASSHLSNAGLTEWIASNLDQYVELAVQMSQDVKRLSELRQQLRPQVASSPLCDIANFVQGLEIALRDMWRTGLQLNVPPG